MDGEACLEIEPVEDHDIIEHTQFIVRELVDVYIIEVQGVAMLVVDGLCHLTVGDAVTISIDNLRITVSFRVVGHTQGQGEVELTELEVVTEVRIESQVTMGGERIARSQVDLVAEATRIAPTQLEGIQQGRHAERRMFRLR